MNYKLIQTGDIHHVYGTENDEYETMFDMLASELNYDEGYEFKYFRPNDNGIGTRGLRLSFEGLVEEAFRNPWEFKVLSGNLTSNQQEFLEQVKDAGLNKKVKYVELLDR